MFPKTGFGPWPFSKSPAPLLPAAPFQGPAGGISPPRLPTIKGPPMALPPAWEALCPAPAFAPLDKAGRKSV